MTQGRSPPCKFASSPLPLVVHKNVTIFIETQQSVICFDVSAVRGGAESLQVQDLKPLRDGLQGNRAYAAMHKYTQDKQVQLQILKSLPQSLNTMKFPRLLFLQDHKPYVQANMTPTLRRHSCDLAALQIGYSSPSLTACFKHPATYGLCPGKQSATVSRTTDISCIPKGALSSQLPFHSLQACLLLFCKYISLLIRCLCIEIL